MPGKDKTTYKLQFGMEYILRKGPETLKVKIQIVLH